MKRNIVLSIFVVIAIVGCCKIKNNNSIQDVANLTSSEYKLLLNPEYFDDYKQGFEDYWSIIQEVAAEQNIPILESDKPLTLGLRHVGFFDTQNFDLRKKGYVIRRRIALKKGERKLGVEYCLKYRSADPQNVTTADVTIAEGYTPKDDDIVLESDIVYNSILNQKTETVFSVQNSIELNDNPPMTIGEFAKIYPVLSTLEISLDEELLLVTGAESVEYKVKLGKLDFGDELYGKMSMSVWRVELEGKQLSIPEFSFDHPFHEDHKYSTESMELCTSFINKLYERNPEWATLGKSKTASLYELADNLKTSK